MNEQRYVLLRNVRLVNAAECRTDGCDIFFALKNGGSEILKIGKNLRPGEIEGLSVINAHGKTVCPPFTDLRCSIPDPGFSYRESLTSGLNAALTGGYKEVLLMPTSQPFPDNTVSLTAQKRNAEIFSDCRVHSAAPLTKGGKGQTLCDHRELKSAGVVAVTNEYEENESSAALLLDGAKVCEKEKMLFIASCKKKSIDMRGAVNKGEMSERFSDRGIDEESELFALSEALILAQSGRARVHFPLVTTERSVDTVRKAKQAGVPISCATSPLYFSFTEDELIFSGSAAKVDPPLRKEKDRLAVIEGLRDGTIDCIVSDHTPVSDAEKKKSLLEAPFGAVGFETAFGAGVSYLVKTGELSLYRLIELMALAPAALLLEDANIKVGAKADLAFIDTEAELVYGKNTMRSKSSNTPFCGRALRGRVTSLYLDGIKQY